MFEVNFGKGGHKGASRKLLDSRVFTSKEDADKAAEFFRELGYWTVVRPYQSVETRVNNIVDKYFAEFVDPKLDGMTHERAQHRFVNLYAPLYDMVRHAYREGIELS